MTSFSIRELMFSRGQQKEFDFFNGKNKEVDELVEHCLAACNCDPEILMAVATKLTDIVSADLMKFYEDNIRIGYL